MAGSITSVDALVAAAASDKSQRIWYDSRGFGGTPPTTTWFSQWTGIGFPRKTGAGTFPTAGLGSAVACSASTTGALAGWSNPTSPARLFLTGHLSFGWTSSQGRNAILLVDRLAHANISRNQATGNFSPVIDGTGRLNAGEGGQIIVECSAALGTTQTDRTFTYTNEAGTASRTSGSVQDAVSAQVTRVIGSNANLFVPLQAGDKGVRSIEAHTLGATGQASGEWCIAIVRPLAMLSWGQGLVGDCDYCFEVPNLPQIRDNSCLAFYAVIGSGTASSASMGEIRMIEV